METFIKKYSSFNRPFFPFLCLIIFIIFLYYKFFLFGKVPFPGDLLVASYSPWFDYYKIPVQNPLISDVFSQFFLWKYLSIDIFKTNNWPLWNPYSFSGTPLLATYHSATLYPLNLLLLLPRYFGWGIFIVSQTLIASLTMYLLLSLWVKSKIARLTGSIIYALSGLMTTWLELGTAVHAMAYLPLIFYALEKYRSNFKLRFLLLLIISESFIILAGHAQITTYSLILIFIFTLSSLKKSFFHFPLIFIALLISILLTSLQLFPSIELLGKSIRGAEVYTQESNFGLLKVGDAVKFFAADFWGNPATRNYWGFLNYSETSGFLGTLTLSLIIYSFIYLRKTWPTKFFLYLFIFSLLLAFDNPISKLIYQTNIPFLTGSFASRILFLTTFSSSILSALSLNQIVLKKDQKNFIKCLILTLAVILGVTIGVIFSFLFIYINIQSSHALENDLKNLLVSLKNLVLPVSQVIFLILVISIFNIAKVRFLQQKKLFLITSLLFLLIMFDLSRYFLKYNPFVDQGLIFPPIPELDILKNQPGIFRIGRENAQILPPNTWIAYGIQSLEGYDPLYLSDYANFMNFLNNGRLSGMSQTRYASLSSNYSSYFLDAANVKYFVGILRDEKGNIPGSLISDNFQKTNYKIMYKGKSFAIFQNSSSLDRAYLAKNFLIRNIASSEDILTDNRFKPTETVLLYKDPMLKNITGKGGVKIKLYSPNMVKIETKTNAEEILILADKFDEGWKAEVDGREVEIIKANLIFRAIKIPQGEHQVIFYYWPKSFESGLYASFITLILLSAITIILIIRRNFNSVSV